VSRYAAVRHAEADEWALIQWRAVRLSMVLSGLDFGGPFPREGQVGSGDVLVRTIRQVAAALSGMATAKHSAVNPLRPREDGYLPLLACPPRRRLRSRWRRKSSR
jgi:hypothetical protein